MNRPLTWFLVFGGLLALSTIFLFTGSGVTLGWLGLPKWLFIFFAIECVLVLAMYLFTRFFWREKSDRI